MTNLRALLCQAAAGERERLGRDLDMDEIRARVERFHPAPPPAPEPALVHLLGVLARRLRRLRRAS
jgi:hypothetical protein